MEYGCKLIYYSKQEFMKALINFSGQVDYKMAMECCEIEEDKIENILNNIHIFGVRIKDWKKKTSLYEIKFGKTGQIKYVRAGIFGLIYRKN